MKWNESNTKQTNNNSNNNKNRTSFFICSIFRLYMLITKCCYCIAVCMMYWIENKNCTQNIWKIVFVEFLMNQYRLQMKWICLLSFSWRRLLCHKMLFFIWREEKLIPVDSRSLVRLLFRYSGKIRVYFRLNLKSFFQSFLIDNLSRV